MTVTLKAEEIAAKLKEKSISASIIDSQTLEVSPDLLTGAMSFLKNTEGLDYLNTIIGTDYWDYLEIKYVISSLKLNRIFSIITRCRRDNPVVPSVMQLYPAAEFQEREIFDLLGIKFEGHPDLRHIVLWEGFQGFPLRKDYY